MVEHKFFEQFKLMKTERKVIDFAMITKKAEENLSFERIRYVLVDLEEGNTEQSFIIFL